MKTIKQDGHWNVLAHVSKLKETTFERFSSIFAPSISSFAHKCFVEVVRKLFLMRDLISNKQLFFGFPEALYVVDVTFRKRIRPIGSIKEVKRFFRGKHKLYRYKVEVDVFTSGLAVCSSKSYRVAMSDFYIFSASKRMAY